MKLSAVTAHQGTICGVALTGRVTLILAVLLAMAMPSLALFAWNRVGRSSSRAAKIRRWTVRGGLVLGAQLSAVILAGVLVNDAGNFYTSWLELLGEKHTVRNVVAVPGSQDAVLRAKLARARAEGRGLVTQISIPGTSPKFGTFSALVYLPAAVRMPEYAHRVFPVVELIAGSPGTPKTWTQSLHVAQILDREIAAGRSSPFIAVMPSQDVAGRRDTQCVNVVHGPNVEMYLTLDVRTVITHSFRASPGAVGANGLFEWWILRNQSRHAPNPSCFRPLFRSPETVIRLATARPVSFSAMTRH